ncbi:MAG: acyltransferase [Proteobacteria bacterium]|nr:acyltransferase [Pseudomonadota bacterium]
MAGHSDGQVFFARIESMRGIAALMVALFHVGQAQWSGDFGTARYLINANPTTDALTLLFYAMANGQGAVIAFFVISGFVLSHALGRVESPRANSAIRFAVARVFRIYPAATVTTTIFVIAYFTMSKHLPGADFSSESIVGNYLLTAPNINGVMWTLKAELLAVPVIMAGFWLGRRVGAGALLVVLLGLGIMQSTAWWTRTPSILYGYGVFFPFVVGIFAYFVGRGMVERMAVRVGFLLFAGAGLVMLFARALIYTKWMILIESLAAGVVVAFLAYGQLGLAGRLFDNRAARFFGRISYSFYLLHPLTLLVIWNMPEQIGKLVIVGVPRLVVVAGLFLASIVAVAPIAWLMYRYVERPGVAFGRWFKDRLRSGAQLQAAR